MSFVSSMLWLAFLLVLLALGWYVDKRVHWAYYRSCVRGFVIGFMYGAPEGDPVDAIRYTVFYLNAVESRLLLPQSVRYPLFSSQNFSEFGMHCIEEYANAAGLKTLQDYCRQRWSIVLEYRHSGLFSTS